MYALGNIIQNAITHSRDVVNVKLDYNKNNLIILEVDDLNFVDRSEDLQQVIQTIDSKLENMKMDAK